MAKHRQLTYGAQVPQSWLDAIQELISTYMSVNAVVTVLNATTVQISAGPVNDQVGFSIGGAWRYNTAPVSASHPGGAAGVYNLWATASANTFAIGPPEVDNTVYAFALQILPVGSTPATALSRIVGSVQWSGTAITDTNLLFDDPTTHGSLVPGDIIWSAAPTRPGALLCDGSAVSRTTYAALFAVVGTTYGVGNGSSTFNLPDFRGRALIGVGSGAGLTGRSLGGSGGEETHLLLSAESGLVAHSHPSGGQQTVNTGYNGQDHSHAVDAMVQTSSTLAGAGPTPVYVVDHGQSQTYGESGAHIHAVTVTDPPSGQVAQASAASAHNNMMPWATGYIFVKV